MSAAPSIQPDPQEDGMTPRMVTMMLYAPAAVTDRQLATEALGQVMVLAPRLIGRSRYTSVAECRTLTPREDAFFRTNSEWMVAE